MTERKGIGEAKLDPPAEAGRSTSEDLRRAKELLAADLFTDMDLTGTLAEVPAPLDLPPQPPPLPRRTAAPEPGERFDPPTVPIDLAGYQELPLPQIQPAAPPPFTVPTRPPVPSGPTLPERELSFPVELDELDGEVHGADWQAAAEAAPLTTGLRPHPEERPSPPGLEIRPAPARPALANPFPEMVTEPNRAPPRTPSLGRPPEPAPPQVERPPPAERGTAPERSAPPRGPSLEPRRIAALKLEPKPEPVPEIRATEPAPPPADRRAPIKVALPARALVVDEDRRAGAEIAARLLEYGFTCRVVGREETALALERDRYDAVVLEVPPEEARQDHGRGALELLASHDGPIVLSSAALLLPAGTRHDHRVAALLTKPYFAEVLVQAIEAARFAEPEGTPPPRVTRADEPRRAAAEPGQAAPESERRVAQRFDLDRTPVRAVVAGGPDGGAGRGRVKNLSVKGGVLLDTNARVPPRAQVSAEFSLLDGRMMVFTGRVVRALKNDVAVKLETDRAQEAFLESFLGEALSPGARAIPPVRFTVREDALAITEMLDDVALSKRWLELNGDYANNELNQRFIQDCLRSNRLEFALARYREAKAQLPEDQNIPRYLQQIGTILSFYMLKKAPGEPEKTGVPRAAKIALMLFLLAGVFILYALLKAQK